MDRSAGYYAELVAHWLEVLTALSKAGVITSVKPEAVDTQAESPSLPPPAACEYVQSGCFTPLR